MDINKLMLFLCLAGTLVLSSCGSSDGNDDSVTVSREAYDALQQKYDILKESVDGTIAKNEAARLELDRIMVELNSVSGMTMSFQQDLERGTLKDNRSRSQQITDAIAAIKKRLNSVSTKGADKQTLALVDNLRKTIAWNEQEIERLNRVVEEKDQQISTLDNTLAERNEQLRQALEEMKAAEKASWLQMGDELVSTADLLPDVKGHGNMKEIKKAKLTILQRAKAAYNQAYQLGSSEAQARIQIADEKYQYAYNR